MPSSSGSAGPARRASSRRRDRGGRGEGAGEGGDHRLRVAVDRGDPQRVHAEPLQFRHLPEQLVDLRGLHLDPVQDQERAVVLGLQGEPVGVLQALQLAVVLGQPVGPGGEAAGGLGEGQTPEGEDLGLDRRRAARLERGEGLPGEFEGHDPAPQPEPGEERERLPVVDVHPGTRDEGSAPEGVQRRRVVRLHQELAVAADPLDRAPVGVGLQDGGGREHDLLARGGEPAGELQPLGEAQVPALRADDLAEIDRVDGPAGDCLVELEQRLARPVVGDGAEGESHRHCRS